MDVFVKNIPTPGHSGKHDKLWNVCFIANNSPDSMLPEPAEPIEVQIGSDAEDGPTSNIITVSQNENYNELNCGNSC